MTGQEKKRRGWGCWVAAALPVLYVLSAGPAVYLRDVTGAGHEFVSFFYWPVEAAYDFGPAPLAAPLRWYMNLWLRTGPPRSDPSPSPLPGGADDSNQGGSGPG